MHMDLQPVSDSINGRSWPKADPQKVVFWPVLMSAFGKSGHWANIDQRGR